MFKRTTRYGIVCPACKNKISFKRDAAFGQKVVRNRAEAKGLRLLICRNKELARKCLCSSRKNRNKGK
jgi:hypothetical protein